MYSPYKGDVNVANGSTMEIRGKGKIQVYSGKYEGNLSAIHCLASPFCARAKLIIFLNRSTEVQATLTSCETASDMWNYLYRLNSGQNVSRVDIERHKTKWCAENMPEPGTKRIRKTVVPNGSSMLLVFLEDTMKEANNNLGYIMATTNPDSPTHN